MFQTYLLRRITRVAFMFLFSAALLACGQEQGGDSANNAEGSGGAEAVGTTAKYDWYMQGSTPAGETTIVKTGDGRITNESFVHWNNREWSVDSELQLDDDGYIISQVISGISPFKAPIDEAFTWIDGVASWRTPGESGTVTSDEIAFYTANEGITFGASGAFVRKALENMDGELALFPTGSARVEKVRETTVAARMAT